VKEIYPRVGHKPGRQRSGTDEWVLSSLLGAYDPLSLVIKLCICHPRKEKRKKSTTSVTNKQTNQHSIGNYLGFHHMVFTTHLVQWLSWVFDPSAAATHLAHFTHPCWNSVEKPFIPLERHTQPQLISAPATTMLATNVTQDAALSLNEFALCHVL